MVSVNQLCVEFGGTTLFDNVSFLVNNKDRIGLVGKNGAGKSTMLKILAGVKKLETGNLSIQAGCTVGYLPQEMVHNLGKTVYAETETAFDEVKKLEKKIHDLNEQLVTRTDHESQEYMDVINDLHEANERFQMIGGYTMQADIELVLFGLGFVRNDLTRMTDEFSGGWRMRIELAKILLQKPNLLLLDEPTNHLDIESIQWLEEFLKTYYGALVMVSHDRAFLDSVTNRTIEISMGKIYDYKTNYSKYVQLRKERQELQLSEQKNQEKYIEHTTALINKFRAKASKASFAQSLIKKLDKLERVEVDEDDNKTMRFRFPPAPASGKVVVEAVDLKKQYVKTVFSHVDFIVERNERIAFAGKNGEGKSTLSKIIVGEEKYEGKLTLGHNVKIGYYAQNQAELLDGERTVFQTIDDIAVGDVRKNVRNLLGSFLFSGDTVEKKVKVLSGGEKSRLAMCKLLLQPYNLLVLDEPTNHLDMRSKDVLKNSLLKYDGTLLIVSHDRDFLQGLTNKVYEFRNGNIKQHIGDVYDFLNSRKIASLAELEVVEKKNLAAVGSSSKQEVKKYFPENGEGKNYKEKKKDEKELRNLKNQITKSEKEIERLEKEIKEIDDKLLDPQQYQTIVNDKSTFGRYEEFKKLLEQEMKRWEELQIKNQ